MNRAKFRRYFPLTVLFVSLVCSRPPIAFGNENIRSALASFTAETAECAVFYSILGQGTDSTSNQWSEGQRFQSLSEELALSALDVANRIDMKRETVMAMMQDYSQSMGEIIGFDAVNIRLLTNKYGEFCKRFVENPQERLMYWIDKESQ